MKEELDLSGKSLDADRAEEIVVLRERLEETKEDMEDLLDSHSDYARQMLKFGLASWIFSLSLVISFLLLHYGPGVLLDLPPVLISLLIGGLAVAFIISAAFLAKKRSKIKELREQGEKLESEYQKNILEFKWRKAKEGKEFLNTLIRQDLGSKYQTIQGYLQLVEGINLPDKHEKFLEKALKACRETEEILELVKKVREIEEMEWTEERNVSKILKTVVMNISDLVAEKKIEIVESYPEKVVKIQADHSINILFLQILKIRIQTSECNKIKISAKDKKGEIRVIIEDDGKRLPKEIKNLFSGKTYKGKTTGVGGARYYMLSEITRHKNAGIEAKDSELGGARFDIHLQNAE